MNKVKLIVVILGIVLILLAPVFGLYLSNIYLRLIGGMETEKFLIIIEGCITGFQVIGALSALCGMLKIHKNQAAYIRVE